MNLSAMLYTLSVLGLVAVTVWLELPGRPEPGSESTRPFDAAEHGVEDGIEWFIARAPWQGYNGYARIPDGHPWRLLLLQWEHSDLGPNIHGGVTYGPDENGWTGFDTGHSGDVWEGELSFGYPLPSTPWDIHWTVYQVAAEARDLARQIAQAGTLKGRVRHITRRVVRALLMHARWRKLFHR